MITENKEPICPISFIEKDKIETRSDINALFLMPYEMNLVANNSHAGILAQDKFIDSLDESKFRTLGRFITSKVDESNINSILSYIVSNVSDSFNSIFFNSILDVNEAFSLGKVAPDTPMDYSPKNIYSKVFDEACLSGLTYNLDGIFRLRHSNYIDPDCAFVALDNMMSSLFAKIMYSVIEPFITTTTSHIMLNDNESAIAKKSEDYYFDGKPITKSLDGYGIYTYYSSLIRDIFNENLCIFRKGLSQMAQSIVWMIFGQVNVEKAITDSQKVLDILNKNELGMIPMVMQKEKHRADNKEK